MRSWLFMMLVLQPPMPSFAQEPEVIKTPVNESSEGWVPIRRFSKVEREAACKKFEGQVISYYGKVYRVESCKRREIESQETMYEISMSKVKITAVGAEVIAAIPPGSPLRDLHESDTDLRTCKQLDRKYITVNFTELYFVENCERRRFPDWETFVDHRKDRKLTRQEITVLRQKEMLNLKTGQPIKSVIDEEFHRLLSGDAAVDVIPIDEACAGIEGTYKSHYSRVYFIEKCHKRELDPSKASKALHKKRTITEMTSSQWLSLPDGPPME